LWGDSFGLDVFWEGWLFLGGWLFWGGFLVNPGVGVVVGFLGLTIFKIMGKFIEDFKAFALKGNVVDMAVGVIIGGAFGKIVTSLVNDIIMPVVSVITGGDGYKNLKYVITEGRAAAEGQAAVEEVAINYGLFIQNIVDFLIIALCIFIALRYTMKFMKKEKAAEEAPAPAPEPTAEEKLLTEIRDILQKEAK